MQTIDHDTGEIIDKSPGALTTPDVLRQRLELARALPPDQAIPELDATYKEAAALVELAARFGLNIEQQNHFAEIAIDTARDGGAILATMDRQQRGRPKKPDMMSGFSRTLDDLGITEKQSSRWQLLASIDNDLVETYKQQIRESGEKELTTAGLLRYAKKPHQGDDEDELEDHQLINQSVSNEWYTPPEYIKATRELMGDIDTDPASNDQANEWIEASTYYTIDTNGFDKPWRGRVWLNPPYGRDEGDSNQERWTARLVEQHRAGITTEAVCLVNAVPGNLWFAPLWNYPICFVARRIRFYDPAGELGQPTHSNVLVYLPDPDRRADQFARFVRIFSQFGPVAARLLEYDGQVFIHGIEADNGDSVPE